MKISELNNNLFTDVPLIAKINPNSRIRLTKPLLFSEVFSIWLIRTKVNPGIVISESLTNSFKLFGNEKCVVGSIIIDEGFLVIIFNEKMEQVFGFITNINA